MEIGRDFVRNVTCEARLRIVVDKMPLPPPNCPKCGGQTKVIGQSEHPVLTYLRCDGCGHVFVPSISRS